MFSQLQGILHSNFFYVGGQVSPGQSFLVVKNVNSDIHYRCQYPCDDKDGYLWHNGVFQWRNHPPFLLPKTWMNCWLTCQYFTMRISIQSYPGMAELKIKMVP